MAQKTTLQPPAVIAAGAYDLSRLTSSIETLKSIKQAYANAVDDTVIFALSSVCVAFLFTLGIEHRNVKKAAKDRDEIGLEKTPQQSIQ